MFSSPVTTAPNLVAYPKFYGAADKDTEKYLERPAASFAQMFTVIGTVLLSLLCVVPIWNASALLQNPNYIFWAGDSVPETMIMICVGIILLFILTASLFFTHAPKSVQTEMSLIMIANMFITLLGFALMMCSLPISRQASSTYHNLMSRCDYSEETHRLYEYSQVLQQIRTEPVCRREVSVKTCAGYKDAPPYTGILEALERDFQCSGFCTRRGAALGEPGAPRATYSDAAGEPGAPLALFSDATYAASCAGMAARDMRAFAGDIGHQTFSQGLYLISIATATSFMKLIGLCVRRRAPPAASPPGAGEWRP